MDKRKIGSTARANKKFNVYEDQSDGNLRSSRLLRKGISKPLETTEIRGFTNGA